MTIAQENLQPLTCPTCGGLLSWQELAHLYQCPLSHAFSGDQLEEALWRLLRENLHRAWRQLQERQQLVAKMKQHGLVSVLPLEDEQTELVQQAFERLTKLVGP